ncbi:hypothetical protein [Sphingomonas sp. CGMCC 1.13658]|nr:hypothetical protein [Sphingomonas sp. CGMCC 1.13658]
MSSAAALPQRVKVLDRFDFARTRLGSFELVAETTIRWRHDIPMIDSVQCRGDNGDIRFVIEQGGRLVSLSFSFAGQPDEEGNRGSLAYLGDELWLFVDGTRYEYRNISAPTNRFSNFTYPEAPGDQIIVPVWRGYHAVRAPGSTTFIDISRIYEDLVKARRLEWGFKSRNWREIDPNVPENQLPNGWESHRYPINKKRLREAVDWCSEQVGSDVSRQLPS